MSYFTEVSDYQLYKGKQENFHWIYNSNSGGGQQFLGGKFFNENGVLSSPTILNGCTGVFNIRLKGVNGQDIFIPLNDKGEYIIKPRGGRDKKNMKLEIQNGTTKLENPNKLISSFFMLPPTCSVGKPTNLKYPILTSNNYWLQSMWLECNTTKLSTNEVSLIPIDFIYCGGTGGERCFKLDAQKRVDDIIFLSQNSGSFPDILGQLIKVFANIYLGVTQFDYECCIKTTKDIMELLANYYPNQYSGIEDPLLFLMTLLPNQIIFYGAPGTGKSHEINKRTKGQDVFRTTFHPDSDYSTFVGCYKPIMGDPKPIYGFDTKGKTVTAVDSTGKEVEEKKIEYKFVKQAFLKAYLKAWKSYTDTTAVTTTATITTPTPVASLTEPIEGDDGQIIPENPNLKNENTINETKIVEKPFYNPVFLIIEEINRGNCAQIFGDIFQLLDRQDNGFSEYPIVADADLQEAIAEELQGVDIKVDWALANYKSTISGSTLSEDIKTGKILLLPNNLYIWATMNTSDQSLFPMDSAFKRRWDWECIPIDYSNEKSKKFTITINKKKHNWHAFLKVVNKRILAATGSEDKQMGNFFIKGDVVEKQFVNKVMFYLWNDVCKEEYDTNNNFFRYSEKKEEQFTFNKLFKDGGGIDTVTLDKFMLYLKVDEEEAKMKKSETEEGVELPEPESVPES